MRAARLMCAAVLVALLVLVGGSPAAAPAGAAATAPARLRVVVLGDTRPELPLEHGGPRAAVLPAIVAAVAHERPDVAFHTGDFVTRGGSRSAWHRYDREFAPLAAAGVSLYPVLGNHEYLGRLFLRSRAALGGYFARFRLPVRDAFGRSLPPPRPAAHPPTGPRWYSFIRDGVLFVVLDSNIVDDLGGPRIRLDLLTLDEWDAQLRFLREHLEAADRDPRIRHVFVLLHHPIYTRSTAHVSARPLWDFPVGSRAERRLRTVKYWLDRSRKLRAVFTGHNHSYERYVCRRDALGPVLYVVVGGGGAPGKPLEGTPAGPEFGPLGGFPNACVAVTASHSDPGPVYGYVRLSIGDTAIRYEMVPVGASGRADRLTIAVPRNGGVRILEE